MFKNKDYSLPGAILIVISQLFSSFQSSDQISKEIDKFRNEFQQSLVDRETFFVRKTELADISRKIDKINNQLGRMTEQIKTLKSVYSYFDNTDETIIGCRSQKKGSI
jgi:hypothetical protein